MIDEELTNAAFGHYSWELKSQSHKPILAACDNCGKVRETSKNAYSAKCRSCARKGIIFTEEWKVNLSVAMKGNINCRDISGESNPNFGKDMTGEKNPHWKPKIECVCLLCSKEFEVWPSIKKLGGGKYCSLSCAAKARRHNARPDMTVPEKIFKGICTKNNLPFKFVGDGTLWLGNANPDFIHTGRRKLVVEVFGDYFHSPLLKNNVRNSQTLEGRRKQLKAEGYKGIFIWESDLKRKDAEAFVMHLMKGEKII